MLKLLWLGLQLVQYCNHTSHLFVHCKNLVCSNERVRSDGGEARGREYYCTHFFSESVSLVSVDC